MEHPNFLASTGKREVSGNECPFSHLLIACGLILMLSAKAS
jgi:hypothetical protein